MPAFRLIIDDNLLNNWFIRGDDMKSGWGYYCKLNVAKIMDQFPFLKRKQEKMENSTFVVSERTQGTGKIHYCAIIDSDRLALIQRKDRWVLTGDRGYMTADGTTIKLHRYIYSKAKGTPKGHKAIHHWNFCAFDNRIDNLWPVTNSVHGSIHAEQRKRMNIDGDCCVKTQDDFLNFIINYF